MNAAYDRTRCAGFVNTNTEGKCPSKKKKKDDVCIHVEKQKVCLFQNVRFTARHMEIKTKLQMRKTIRGTKKEIVRRSCSLHSRNIWVLREGNPELEMMIDKRLIGVVDIFSWSGASAWPSFQLWSLVSGAPPTFSSPGCYI